MASLYRDTFDRVPVGVAPHGVGEWDHLVHGNHRAVVEVAEDCPAICAYLPWRRRDRHPAGKHVRVVSAATGNETANSLTVSANREYGEVVFEPVDGPGTYYCYYLIPVQDAHAHTWPRWAFPISRYLPAQVTASDDWRAANGLAPEAILPLPQSEIGFDGAVPAEGDLGLAKRTGKVLPAPWRTLPEARLVAFEARSEWDSFFPMELVATQDERIGMEYRGRYRPFLLFPEDRRTPIRMTEALPHHWAVREVSDLDTVTGEAARNEYFVFQLGLYAHRGTVTNLGVTWSGPTGPGDASIPGGAMTCFNTEGIDQNGQRFEKAIHVETRKVQALWFGVDIPEDAVPGPYEGTVTVTADEAVPQTVRILLDVGAEVLADRGDSDHWRLSRLRWLNSTLGLDDEVCPPYTAVEVNGLSVGILGRDIVLGENGMPTELASRIDMFEITGSPRSIISSPTELTIVAAGGELLPIPQGCVLQGKTQAAAVYEAHTPVPNVLAARHETRVEAEGVVVSRLTLTAREAIELETMRLRIELPADVAQLVMRPTTRGGIHDGGCPDRLEHGAWELEHFWVGDTNAGLGLRLPPVDAAGGNRWDNQHLGTFRLEKAGGICTLALDSGAVALEAGESASSVLEFYVTPFRPLPREHWDWRYYHAEYHTALDVEQGHAAGAKIFTQHHETVYNPYINYPLLTADRLKEMADAVHEKGGLFKFYYTIRELSVRCPELWALRSLGDEILEPAVGHLGFAEMDDLPCEYQLREPYGHPNTGMPWLCEHLVSDYHTRWHSLNKSVELADGSLQVIGAGRWGNWFIESLRWLMAHAGLDGLYFDGLTFDRASLRRVRKTLVRGKPQGLVDNHGGPFHLDRAPFYDSLWFGEGADYTREPEYWLTLVSGIPFGLPGELLLPNASVVRGMVYGVCQRYGWMPLDQVDPSGLWRWWDDFDIKGAEMLGYWQPGCPVTTNHPMVKATAYVHNGKRCAIALASWADTPQTVALEVDWERVGLSPGATATCIPDIRFFQEEKNDVSLNGITVDPAGGWILILEGTPLAMEDR